MCITARCRPDVYSAGRATSEADTRAATSQADTRAHARRARHTSSTTMVVCVERFVKAHGGRMSERPSAVVPASRDRQDALATPARHDGVYLQTKVTVHAHPRARTVCDVSSAMHHRGRDCGRRVYRYKWTQMVSLMTQGFLRERGFCE